MPPPSYSTTRWHEPAIERGTVARLTSRFNPVQLRTSISLVASGDGSGSEARDASVGAALVLALAVGGYLASAARRAHATPPLERLVPRDASADEVDYVAYDDDASH